MHNYLIQSFVNNINLIINVSDSGKNIEISNNYNINNYRFNASVNKKVMNNVAPRISAADLSSVGIKVAQYVNDLPSIKLAAYLSTMGVVQDTSNVMYKILNNNHNIYITNINEFIYRSNTNEVNIINKYTLNIFSYINLLLYAALLLMSIIFNLYIVKYFKKVNYEQWISDKKTVILVAYLRYITVWSKVNQFLLVYCYVLFITIIIAKFYLSFIMSYYY
jgi:hypothetical protein